MTPETETYLDRRAEVLAKVKDLLLTRLRVELPADQIDPDVFLFGTGLGLDSIDAVELVVALEDTFKLKLPEGARTLQALRTVGTVVDTAMAEDRS